MYFRLYPTPPLWSILGIPVKISLFLHMMTNSTFVKKGKAQKREEKVEYANGVQG